MKKFLFLMSLCLCINSQAADIYVNSSGQSGSYPTLAGALAAANNGDRILVSNVITLTETDTINKSVTIISTAPGDQFELIGDLYVEAVSGLEIRIIGLKQTGDIYCLSGTASGTNVCNLHIIDSEISGGVNCDIPGLVLNLLYSKLNNNIVIFRDGKLIANQIGGFYIAAGDNVNYNDTILIIANKIYNDNTPVINVPNSSCSVIYVNNYANYDTIMPNCQNAVNTIDHFIFIANNFFYNYNSSIDCQLFLKSSNSSSSGQNTIVNNTFYNKTVGNNSSSNSKCSWGRILTFYFQNSHNNTRLLNNIGLGGGSWSNIYNGLVHPALGTGNDNGQFNNYSILIDSNYIPTFEYNHFGGWGSTYSNYIVAEGYSSSWNDPNDVFNLNNSNNLINITSFKVYRENGKAFNATDAINAGKNSIEYYDIDMTRNDIGTYGGPYSWDNYWNTASGSARIYNLDLPFEVWSGQPNVKADAVHQK